MSHKPRSSRITALALAVAIGASSTLSLPVVGAQTTGGETTTQATTNQAVENSTRIDATEHAPEEETTVRTVILAQPGESYTVTLAGPAETTTVNYNGAPVSEENPVPDIVNEMIESTQNASDNDLVDEDELFVSVPTGLTGDHRVSYLIDRDEQGTEEIVIDLSDSSPLRSDEPFSVTQGGDTTISGLSQGTSLVGGPTGVTIAENGSLSVGYGTPAGTYPLYYSTTETVDDQTVVSMVVNPEGLSVTAANLNEDYTPSYPSTTIRITEDDTTLDVVYEGDAPTGDQAPSYALADNADLPDGWDVTVNENTGTVTVNARPGTSNVEVPVTVTYPDGTTDTADIVIERQGQADTITPSWSGDNTITPGRRMTVDYDGDDLPPGTEIRISGLPWGWTSGIGLGNTILVTAPDEADHETVVPMTVTVTYQDGSTDQVTVDITVNNPSDSQAYELGYITDQSAPQQGQASYEPSFGSDDPDTQYYAMDTNADWLSIDEVTGVITAAPGENVLVGAQGEAMVTVTYADGTTDETRVTITVGNPATSVSTDFTYPDESVRINQSVEIVPSFDPDVEGEVTYSVEGSLPGWVQLDESTGVLTASPGGTVPVRSYQVTVVATYPDMSRDTATATISVTAPFYNERTEVSYSQGRTAPRGDATTVIPNVSPEIPSGTTFSLFQDEQLTVPVNPAQQTSDLFSIDESTGAVTITPSPFTPLGANTATVYIVYPDESADEATVSFTVSDMSTGDNPVTYQTHDVNQGATGVFTPVTEDGDYTYAPGGNFPTWASIDEDTGVVTVTPGYRVPTGERSFMVDFTYPDGSTGFTEITMTVNAVEQSQWLDPNYAPVTVVAGQVMDSDLPNFGTNGQPIGNVRYEIGQDGPDWARVDSNGVVTVESPLELEGETVTVPVVITYSDGSVDETDIDVEIVDRADRDVYTPSYQSVSVAQDRSRTLSINYGDDTPEGVSYAKGTGFPAWAELAPDGTITVTPTFGGTSLGSHQLTVQVTYADGTNENVSAGVTVTRGADADNYDLSYLGGSVEQGEQVTMDPVIVDYNNVAATPENTAYRLIGAPDWVTVNPSTGAITASPVVDTPMTSYQFQVEVIYADGTRDTTATGVNVTGTTDATRYQLTYGGGTRVEQGDTASGDAPLRTIGEPMPEGTTLSAVDAPEWVTVNEDGTYTVAPGYNVSAGNHPVTVLVTYADASSERILLPIIVDRAEIAKEFDSPFYQALRVTQGHEASSAKPVQGSRALPQGSSYRLQYGSPNWVQMNPGTGAITVAPGFRVTPDTYQVPVTIVYPDGSRVSTELEVMVELGRFADGYSPSYSSGIDAPQGSQVTIPSPRDADGQRLPAGTKYDTHGTNPGWVSVGVDGTVTASPGFDIDPGSYQALTLVTYEDGTVDEVPVAIRVLPEDDPAAAPVTSTPGGFTDYSEDYIPSWQRSDGGTSVSASGLTDGYTINDDGEVVDGDGRVVEGASVNDDGTVSIPEERNPVVNTGGSIASSGFWAWLVSLFR